jgi:hypothetical protein
MGKNNGKKKSKLKDPTGPRADTIKIDMDWRDAIKQSLLKQKPTDGWLKSA